MAKSFTKMRWDAVGCGGMRWEKYAVENVHIGVVGASTNRVVVFAGDPSPALVSCKNIAIVILQLTEL